MEKQEKIHNEWYDLGITLLSSQYDSEGWIDVNELEKDQLTNKLNFKEYNEPDVGFKTMICRPKSLQGIENNNGWIKIESEADLPKEYCEMFVFDKENNNIKYREYFNTAKKAFVKLYSHYQPIQKPQPPIY